MPPGKNIVSFFRPRNLVILLFALFGINLTSQGQTDDLMIVKYVDWDSGQGFGAMIWNPTPKPIDLANYRFRIYTNGGGNGPTLTGTVLWLSGILEPCSTVVIANWDYRFNNCPNAVTGGNLGGFQGVDGNDAIAITLVNGQIVDAIGRVLYNPGNNSSQTVANVPNALFQHTLERAPGNTARYTLTTGQYNPNITNAANIWPDNKTTNVTGWLVSNSNCLTTLGATSVTVTANAGQDTSRICKNLDPFVLAASVTGFNLGLQWTGGKGIFSNPNSAITTYSPSPQDHYRTKLKLTLTSCGTSVSDEVIIFNGDSTLVPTGLTYSPQNPGIGDTVTFTLKMPSDTALVIGRFNYGDGSPVENRKIMGRHVYSKAGTFEVKVAPFNIWGCPSDTLTARIVIPEIPIEVFIPNIFTPNNDNLNDTYAPQLPATSTYALKVYNRWGMLIFESNDQNKPWDGKNTLDGVYFVHLKAVLKSGEILNRKLPVTLLR